MSELIVVRHGQASFMTEDYDRLSPLGLEQSRLLGHYWAGQGLCPTAMVVGPRRRQRETAEALREAMKAGGMAVPEMVREDRLDEFDWDGLKRYADSTLSASDGEVAELKAAFEGAAELGDKRRTIQHYMEAVMARWVAGRFYEEGLETWEEFRSRVEVALRLHTADSPRGSRVVFITSGGVAAAAAGVVLGLTPAKTVGLIWTLRNSAMVEFLYHGGTYSLGSFNSAPHLPARDLWSYR